MTGKVANDPALVGKLVKICNRNPMPTLVANLDAQMQALQIGTTHLPTTISDGPNCYICDPTAAYIDYAIEETRHFTTKPLIQKLLLGLISTAKPLLRTAGLDRQVQPNNWLFSTNPVPDISKTDATQLRDDLTGAHPDRVVVIRSLNPIADANSMAALKSAGFTLLASRQIYIFDPTTDSPTTDAKRDRKLLTGSPYTIAPAATFSADDFTRAAELYNMLYLDKYTTLNPQYTASFLAQAHQIELLDIIGLRGNDGQLDGLAGLFANGNTLTMPILGYDTSKPQKLGLYRMLNAIGHQQAIEHGMFYNMSAGAAEFKRNRGAAPTIEYSAIYVGHLKWRQRIATGVIKTVLNGIGVPLLKRFKL